MIETFAALYFAHIIADFVLQTNWMATNKARPRAVLLHGLAVLGTAALALGTLHPVLIALTAAHLGLDLIKANRRGIWPFLADQAAHLGSVVVVTALLPVLWAQGAWAHLPALPGVMALTAGFILTTRAGGFAVAQLMEPWASATTPEGLPSGGLIGGGRAIGNLERGVIFLLVLLGQAAGIGFLIAAKSVLRFGSVTDDRKFSEYVIIGTLASFGWAIAASFATLRLLAALPPIGIPGLTP